MQAKIANKAKAVVRKVVDEGKKFGAGLKHDFDSAKEFTVSKSKKASTASKAKAVDTSKKLPRSLREAAQKAKKTTSGSKKDKLDAKTKRLAALPSSPVKRFFYRLHPKQLKAYWFSRSGLIMLLRIGAVGLLFLLGVFLWFSKDIPTQEEINARRKAAATKFYDRTGETLLFEVYGDVNRTIVERDRISDNMRHATIAIEDKDFYNHGAFSVSGILRSVFYKLTGRTNNLQGGSTITQQYVKNAVLSPERSLTRKIKELIVSVRIEQLYTKDEILTFYLNEIPYGAQEYGVEAAANSFFDKSASDLTIDEAALLASVPQAPSFYSPYGNNLGILVDRQHTTINAMHEQGYITAEERDAALATDTLAKINDERSLYRNIKAPHFVLWVQEQLEKQYGTQTVLEGGLVVITTLDMDKQEIAEEAIKNGMPEVVRRNGDNAALTAADVDTSQVLAMVGSRDFNYPKYGSFNAALAGRQPGSSFKPYVYSELFKSGKWGPGSVVYDVVTDFGGGYKPTNFNKVSSGAMPIRRALAESKNVPAVKALYMAGVDNSIAQAKRMGITTLNAPAGTYGLSLVLGAGEVRLADHVNGYATFARGGIFKEQVTVLKVSDQQGKVLEEWTPTEGESVLDEEIAYLITDVLSDSRARTATYGTNQSHIDVAGLTHAVKTGTTDLARDGWMMGYSTDIAAGVWVGNHDNVPMRSTTSRQTGPIFTEFMRRVHEGRKDEEFKRPEGIKSVKLDSLTGKVPNEATKSTHTDIFPSFYKAPKADDANKVVLDSVSKKLATKCTPERAKEEVLSNGIDAEIPRDDPAYSRWLGAIKARYPTAGTGGTTTEKDDVHDCSDKKPEISLDATHLFGSTYRLEAEVTEKDFDVTTVNFLADGQIVSSQAISGSGTYSYTHTLSSTGAHTFAADVIDKVLYDNRASVNVNPTQLTNSNDNGFTLVAPANNSSAGFPVGLDWDAHSQANKYEVWLKKPGGTFTLLNTTSSTSTNCLGNCSDNGSYQWYVKALFDDYVIQQTKQFNFTR